MNPSNPTEQDLLSMKIWAVVGANSDLKKFGNRIYRRLKSLGYTVFAVNPLYREVDGDLCYARLADLPQVPDIVDFVVTPKRVLPVLEQMAERGIRYAWMQPGTVDDAVLKRASKLGLTVHQGCVLAATSPTDY